MRARVQLAFMLLAFAVASAQVVDRMVAVVNKRVILESELDQNARVECLMQGKALDRFTAGDRGAVLDRLIDRALLDQQIVSGEMLDPTPEELTSQLKQVREQIAPGASDERWRDLLTRYGLVDADVREYLTAQFRFLRLVDLRFRGLVRVDKNEINAYYQDKLLPQLRKEGAAEPPLSQVSDKIEKVLTEQSIGQMLQRWLETLRSQAHIEKMAAAASGGALP